MKRMWTIPTIIGIGLLAWAAFEGIRFAWLVGQSAKLVEQSHAFERTVDGGTPRILIGGDSTAVGTGTTPEGSTAGHFGADFPRANIRNVSVNGWKIADLLEAFPMSGTYDLVVLQIGANDIIRGTPEKEFETSLRALFAKAKARSANVVALHSGNIGLAPMFPWPVNRVLRARTLRYRAIYRAVATEHGVAYVDLYAEKEEDVLSKDIPKYYADDLLHLTAEGYGVWYDAIRKTMKESGMLP
jgi:lysophospholipase L1-like esterase